jgi:hypothetical protein
MRISTSQLKTLIAALYQIEFTDISLEKYDDEAWYIIKGPSNNIMNIEIRICEDMNLSDIKLVEYVFHDIMGTWIFNSEDKNKEPYPIVKKLWALAKNKIAQDEIKAEEMENTRLRTLLTAFYEEIFVDENYTGREMTPDEY